MQLCTLYIVYTQCRTPASSSESGKLLNKIPLLFDETNMKSFNTLSRQGPRESLALQTAPSHACHLLEGKMSALGYKQHQGNYDSQGFQPCPCFVGNGKNTRYSTKVALRSNPHYCAFSGSKIEH